MFVAEVQACIDEHAMLPPGATIIVAVSGGADSVALLSVLYRLCAVYGVRLVVAHVNHQLRGEESHRDALFVEQYAARLGVPFHADCVDVKAFQHTLGLSPQHAARHVRYECFSRLQDALRATRIALGHTADDQAETLLLRLLRGSGPAGLSGIAPVRLSYIRPLITVHRQVLRAYLQAEGIPWVEDSSNAQRVYVRNRVRLDLLPILRQYNPQVDKRLNELADMLSAENRILERQTDEVVRQAVHWQPGKRLLIDCVPCGTAPLALQRRLLRRVVETLFTPGVTASFRHIENLRHLIVQGQVGKRLTLPDGWIAERDEHMVWLWNPRHLPAGSLVLTFPVPGQVEISELALRISADIIVDVPNSMLTEADVAYIDLERVQPPLTVRFRRPGDRFYPLGAPGRKKLKDFFIDRKIPKTERNLIPLVLSGSEIVWVVGRGIAEGCKVRPQTRRMVRLRYETEGLRSQ